MDDDDFEFEFESFPEDPGPREDLHEETPWDTRGTDEERPRPRAEAAAPSDNIILRRRVAAAAVAAGVILLIVLIVVLTSGSSGGGNGYADYLTKIAPIASDSAQSGTSLDAALSSAQTAAGRKDVVAKLDALARQASDQITRLEALRVPAALSAQQAQALAALDLRLRGLRGLRDSFSQALASQSTGSWDAVASAQVDDLITSDLIWDGARTSTDGYLQAHGITGFFPASTFVTAPTSLLAAAGAALGHAGTAAAGPTLSLGSTGPAVVGWQNQLNRWLKLTAPAQTPLTADGTFGASTRIATEQLQTAQGLAADGVVGASTRQALQRALAGHPSSSPTSPAAPTLKLGDTGPGVVAWQNQLNRWLRITAPTQTPLTADGSFGTATQTTTEQLQTAAGLTPTGQVDAATRQALTTALARAGQTG